MNKYDNLITQLKADFSLYKEASERAWRAYKEATDKDALQNWRYFTAVADYIETLLHEREEV